MILRHDPKDNEPRTLRITSQLAAALEARINTLRISHASLLFANQAGQPISRSTFRARVWLPAAKATGLDFHRSAREVLRKLRVASLRGALGTWQTPVGMIFRDPRAFRPYDGPTEVHAHAIAREVLG